MQFLVVNQETTANIYGHIYKLKPIDSPIAGPKDILVTDDGSASELLRRHKDKLSIVSFEREKIDGFPLPLRDSKKIPDGSKVLILRSGGIGDHIMLTPAIRGFREHRMSGSDIELWLATQEDMFPLFKGNPFIDRLLPLPLTMDELFKTDYFLDFSESIQASDFNRIHPTDYYLEFVGIKTNGITNKMPLISLDTIVSSPIIQVLKGLKNYHQNRPLILIQWEASVQIRTFPPKKLSALTHKFTECTFVIAHHHIQTEKTEQAIREENIKAINISNEMKDLTYFLGAVGFVDGVISTDSSAYHIAAAFDKPSLALFGPIASSLRTRYYPKVISLDANYNGKICKSPCVRHKGTCPEAKQIGESYSPCLLSISENDIHDGFQELLDNYLSKEVLRET
jgi:ADP-heptose:LPS heptosyltransferase